MGIALLVGVLSLFCGLGWGRWVEGSVGKGSGKFAFLGKFAFGVNSAGEPAGRVVVSTETSGGDVEVLFFDDEADSWPAVQDSGLSCKTASSPKHYRPHGSRPLPAGRATWTEKVKESASPRYWWIGVASEGCTRDVEMDSFSLHFTQGDGSELSYDERALPTLYALLLVAWLGGCVFLGYTRWTVGPFPSLLRVLLLAYPVKLLSVLLALAHWAQLGSDGIGCEGCLDVASGCGVVAHLLVYGVGVLMAMGVGLETFSVRITSLGNMFGIAALVFTLFLYVMLSVWYDTDRPAYSTLYVYDTGVGVSLVTFHLLFCVWWSWKARQQWLKLRKQHFKDLIRHFSFAFVPLTFVLLFASIVAAASPAFHRLDSATWAYEIPFAMCIAAISYILWPSRIIHFFRDDTSPQETALDAATTQEEDRQAVTSALRLLNETKEHGGEGYTAPLPAGDEETGASGGDEGEGDGGEGAGEGGGGEEVEEEEEEDLMG